MRTTGKKRELKRIVRFFTAKDLPAVLAILNETGSDYTEAITRDDIHEFATSQPDGTQTAIKVVCSEDGTIVGVAMVRYTRRYCRILRICVSGRFRRKGYARQLLENILDNQGFTRRNKFLSYVHERSLDVQLFFRSMGFRANPEKAKTIGEDKIYPFRKVVAAKVQMA